MAEGEVPTGSAGAERGDALTVTVAVCTFDRPALLDITLRTLAGMSVPGSVAWELLVVDNAGTDETADVVAGYRDQLPVRYLVEEERGLSYARNRAVREARGEFIVWTDDDVRVGRRWLSAYAEAFERWPGTAFFGGPLRPWFEEDPPRWLTRAFDQVEGAYAVKDLGSDAVALEEFDDLPFGANMAFRTEVLRRKPFDVRLGRRGRNLMLGEETQLMLELVEEGERGRWVPEARVEHFIPRGRQTVDYLRRYYRAHGRISQLRPEADQVARLFGRPRWAWRAFLEREPKFWLSRLTDPPEEWIPRLKEAAYVQGVLLGYHPTAEAERT